MKLLFFLLRDLAANYGFKYPYISSTKEVGSSEFKAQFTTLLLDCQ